MIPSLDPALVALLRCPHTARPLMIREDRLVTDDGSHAYAITPDGIPLLAGDASADARIQERHYDRIAARYAHNLAQDHTREYFAYLDRALFDVVGDASLDTVAEVCCGAGEALHLFGCRVRAGIGIDISLAMLAAARAAHPGADRLFVQGDAVRLPLADACVDAVLMLGGIHHVNDRDRLFAEVHRVLRNGGRFFWREPVDDFPPWRLARDVIYRVSATLESSTERPLRRAATVRCLESAGFDVTAWRPLGFLGYSLLMNSDVLRVNRGLSYVPGARTLTRAAAAFDDLVLQLPGLGSAGALVIGSARRR